jgi:hypothetical protein
MANSALAEIERLKDSLQLQPHPEGGFFAETYRAESTVAGAKGDRSASTAIYFLITPDAVNASTRKHRTTIKVL